ncbi:TonB-dependent siderophore receptor [Parasphingopyxis sp.]|uniref:TonB-dependent receptor plug domain-containing protein n=1 Tax=Parasphingopyxis sp. TaxID=1920299 RepID=UPI00260A7246|nr:TonB-dependent receptor [Parasphingopyxis sp.]
MLASTAAHAQVDESTAQTLPTQTAEAGSRGATIVVTGSRIERTAEESAVPLQVFGTEDFEDIGSTDLAEAIQQLPGISEGVSVQDSNSDIQTAGLSTISLRRLGDDRTLVLINGRRAVSNSGNSDRVSLSTIPVGFVQRTEVTTGGASAIYGSDAIAGVANFVLNDSFEGYEIDARYSTPEASGGEEYRINGRIGLRFAEDRGYVMAAVSYRDENEVLADDSRPLSVLAVEFDDPATGSNDTFADEINTPGCDPDNEDRHCLLPSFSGTTPGGVFEGGDAWFKDGQWFNDQSLQPPDRTGSQDFLADFDGFNIRPGRTLQGSREILNIGLHASYEFSPAVEFSVVGLFSRVDSETRSGVETLNDDDAFGLLDAFEVGNIASDHPFIPPEVEETRSGSVSFDRRLIELGEQARINRRDTIRIMADLEGSLTDSIDWTVFGTYGRFEQDQWNPNEINFRNAQFALDIEEDGAGGFQCADAGARADGCVPLNIFGEGTVSQAAADYIRYNGFATQSRTQYTAGGFIRGDLFRLGDGDVKFAAGIEYRREEQSTEGDPDGDPIGGQDGDPTTDDAFLTSLATFPSLEASFDVVEAFAEIDIPIIANELFLQGAVRVSEYSTVGTIFSYNIGAVWQAADALRFRAQYSRSQRAPNITEIFSPPRPDSDDLRDPCDGLLPNGSGLSAPESVGGEAVSLATVAANCLSEPGIQAFFADPDNAGEAFEFDGSVQGPNSGNPNVQEETANTYTFGAVFTPPFAPGLTLIADYYRIEISDAITSISTQNNVDLCYAADDFPNNRFCDVISRNPFNGEVVEVINFQENLEQELVEGIDFALNWEDIEFSIIPGEFDINFRYSRYFKQQTTFIGLGGQPIVNSPLGEIEDGRDEWRLRLGYRNGGFRLAYIITYEAGGIDDLVNDPFPSNDRFFRVDGQDFHRISARYSFGPDNNYRISAGVNNIFNNYGPLYPSGTDDGNSRNIVSDLNDSIGREFWVGFRARF